MSKRIQNLERLCQKMQTRYGLQDTMVLELMEELAILKLQPEQSEPPLFAYRHNSAVRPKAEAEFH